MSGKQVDGYMPRRIMIWSDDQTPLSGSGRRLVYVEPFERGRGATKRTLYRVRSRTDQRRPDILTRRQLDSIRVETDGRK